MIRHLVKRNIFGNIDHHRARSAAACNVECFFHDQGHVAGIFDQEVVLHDRAGDAHGIAFLEGIKANSSSGHLATDNDHGNTVHVGRCNAGDSIGKAGARCDQSNTDITRGAGIAIGRMHSSLLVANQDVLNGVLLEEGIVDVQYRTAWVTPDVLDVLGLKGFNENFATAQIDGRQRRSCAVGSCGGTGHFSFGDFHIQPL